MTNRDILLAGILVFLAFGIYSGNRWIGQSEPDKFVVSLDGQSIYEGSLKLDRTVEIRGGEIYLLLKVKDHRVNAIKADCPKKICVTQGAVYNTGQTIVCVPQKLTVTVKGGRKTVDAITR